VPTISIDLRMLHASGVGTYLRNLVPLVISACPNAEFCLMGKLDEISSHHWAHSKNVLLVDCRAPIYSVAEQLELFRKTPKGTELFWSPHYNIPLLYGGKLLVTVHDVFHLAMPQYAGGLHKRLYAKGMFVALRRKADAILCDSAFTKKELVRLTGWGRQEVHTVHIGVDVSWFHVSKNRNPHSRPFLLFVGNVKPHKNLKTLIETFGLIKDDVPHDLVIVGRREGFITGDETVVAEAATLGDRVRFTGYVGDDLLRQYLAHADALVLPSLYEGFGLPPLEAMACRCPVIVSNAASLPEVCGDAALYCDPHDPTDIADKIRQLTNDMNLQDALRQRGLERAKQFTWEKCAQETLAVIREVLRED
jgi:glycosyltransferase involved in cell wall biosynthesis